MKKVTRKIMEQKNAHATSGTDWDVRVGYALLPVCLFAFLLFLSAMHFFHIESGTDLSGVTLAAKPGFTAAGVADGSYQRDWENWMNDNFFAHTVSVKMCNQILYSVFQDGSGDVCIGTGHSLMSRGDSLYAAAPDRAVQQQEAYDEYAQSVYALQTRLEQWGKGFVYLIVPAKIDIYPDMIPWNYRLIRQTRETGIPDARERTIAAFEKYGVNYYDLADDIMRMRESADFEVFSKTGYHWTLTAVASEMNPLFQKLSVMTPGIDYPEVNVTGTTDELFSTDKDLFSLFNVYSDVKGNEYISPLVDCPRTSGDKVYYIGTSMGYEIYEALTADKETPAFDQIIYQMYSTTQLTANKTGETVQDFQESDPPEALHIMEHIQDSDLIIMEQLSLTGPGLHNKFLNYANEHLGGLFYHLGNDLVKDYEGKSCVNLSGDYGLEGGTHRWVEKKCDISVCGDELKDAGRDITMSLSISSYHVDQTVRVTVNGEETAVCQITPNVSEVEVVIPADIIEPEVNSIELTMLGDPCSPKQLGESEDARYLGFALTSIVLEVSE